MGRHDLTGAIRQACECKRTLWAESAAHQQATASVKALRMVMLAYSRRLHRRVVQRGSHEVAQTPPPNGALRSARQQASCDDQP